MAYQSIIKVVICIVVFSVVLRSTAECRSVNLKVVGNERSGYSVTMLFGDRPVATHVSCGELSAVFENADRTCRDHLEHWKATQWEGDAKSITLTGTAFLKQSNANLMIEVVYEVLDDEVVRKRIRMSQSDMYTLFYQVTNILEAAKQPAKFWSFDQVDNPGGAFREYYPAAGFRTRDGLTVGLLTDAGHRNHWTRMYMRCQNTGKLLHRIPDLHLYEVSTDKEREAGCFQVRQTFGRADVIQTTPALAQTLALSPDEWQVTEGLATVTDSTITIKGDAPRLIVPLPFELNQVYRVSLKYRSTGLVSTRMQGVDDQLNPKVHLGLYRDNLPAEQQWQELTESQLIWNTQMQGLQSILWIEAKLADGQEEPVSLEIEQLKIQHLPQRPEPYSRMAMGETIEKTSFIFVDDQLSDTIHDYRLASQVHLADALGFQGGTAEKVIFADTMMLCWIADPECPWPVCVPSIYYGAAGEMYLRDAMFSVNGLADRTLNESIFRTWGLNQRSDGTINTLLDGAMGHIEHKDNDSTPLWLMWALRNRQRFGSPLPTEQIQRAARYCLDKYDPDCDGKPVAQFVLGQNDVIHDPEGISDLAVNQGMWAVTLRVIKELGAGGDIVTDDYIAKAEEAYRSYYEPELKRIRVQKAAIGAIGFDEIWPEFLSLWLFNHKILTDEMVCNHLDAIPVMLPREDAPYPEQGGIARPIFVGKIEQEPGWRYFSYTFHPVVSEDHARNYKNHQFDGMYYNGGSWMRLEICGYAAGKLHGWKQADAAIANRLWAEIHSDPDFPTSTEYLPTDPKNQNFGSHRVFAWNSFVFQAMELAGLRTPEMTPGFQVPSSSY